MTRSYVPTNGNNLTAIFCLPAQFYLCCSIGERLSSLLLFLIRLKLLCVFHFVFFIFNGKNSNDSKNSFFFALIFSIILIRFIWLNCEKIWWEEAEVGYDAVGKRDERNRILWSLCSFIRKFRVFENVRWLSERKFLIKNCFNKNWGMARHGITIMFKAFTSSLSTLWWFFLY